MTSLVNVVKGLLTAKAPVAYTAVRSGMTWGRQSNISAPLTAMESDGTLFAVVGKTSESIAGVEWRMYRKRKPGDTDSERVEVMNHPAIQVWNKPNPFMSQQRLVETFAQHLKLVGEAWLIASRPTPNTMPNELWPVRPDRMRPIEDTEVFLTGYEYTSPLGERVPLPTSDVVFILRPNPNDMYRGLGPVQALMSHIDASRYSAEWNRQFFLSSAEPGGIIKVDATLSERSFDRLQAQWNEHHAGVQASHRVAILEQGTEWVPNMYTRRDMQFAEMMEVSDDKILRAFAFPKFMLGIVDDVNRSNAQESEYIYAKHTLVPELERIKTALNHQFLGMFGAIGEGVEFDYISPVPKDVAAEDTSIAMRASAAVDLINAGFDATDVQKALGLPNMAYTKPVKDGGAKAPTDYSQPTVENALRWEAKATLDGDTCGPCRENDGKVYRNRAEAYKDYPGGTSYKDCMGEEYGNQCRCKVVKRGNPDNVVIKEV